jgi:hypothetical protein
MVRLHVVELAKTEVVAERESLAVPSADDEHAFHASAQQLATSHHRARAQTIALVAPPQTMVAAVRGGGFGARTERRDAPTDRSKSNHVTDEGVERTRRMAPPVGRLQSEGAKSSPASLRRRREIRLHEASTISDARSR